MNLKKYLKSPNLGKRIPYAKLIKEDLDKRYMTLLKKKKKEFKAKFYNYEGVVIVHCKVPSETVNDMTYDLILELAPHGDSKSIFDHEVTTITNSPNFIYQFAYVYKTNKLLSTRGLQLEHLLSRSLVR